MNVLTFTPASCPRRWALGAAAALGLAAPTWAQQPTYSTFTGFTTGVSVDGQGGWSATNPNWDEEVVDLAGNLVWRVSNAVTSGSFGDQPIAPASDLYAGESAAVHANDNAAPVTDRFYASFDIWSVTGAPQAGLDITVSPDDGTGKRQSFLSIEDNGAGIDIDFFDSQGNHPTTNPNGGFVLTEVATGLSYGSVHTIAFDMTFVEGIVIDGGGNVFGNDIVRIFVDGQLVHTGTSWESYYWTTTEGQTPPGVYAVDTLLFRLSTPGTAGLAGNGYYVDNVFVSTKCPTDFQGFEADVAGWQVFSNPVYHATRVASGTDGIPSASGAWHAVGGTAYAGTLPAGNWGGYSGNCDCASASCATSPFPEHGYTTSLAIYLDMDAGFADDTRFDYSSAINRPNGAHRRDFIFSGGFYSAGDGTAPGAGSDRFIFSASNNAPGWPANPARSPIAVTATGWYTFQHRFYRTAMNVLAVEMTVLDDTGTVMGQWTLSDATDIVGVTVGGNRYAWFPTNQFPRLAFDDAARVTGGQASMLLTVEDCQDDVSGDPGYQVAVDLEMADLASYVTGYQAFVEYDLGALAYRGDLSTYAAGSFPLHITPIGQADDGLLELDGSASFGGAGTGDDEVLATLVFDVLTAACNPDVIGFQTGGAFDSELSFNGLALDTALVDPMGYTFDDTPPVLSPCPLDIVQASDANSFGGCDGAFVAFADPTATDNCDPSPAVVCTPPSGSFFALGVTTVTCTATDACGNVSSCTFDVEVTPTNEVDVEVELVGVSIPVTRCIHFQAIDDCSAVADQLLDFVDHDGDDANMNGIVDATEGGSNTLATPVRAIDTVSLPCGVYTSLCAKDRQHTRWAETPALLDASGPNYVALSLLSLDGGDTDDDGDVDINDVTFLLAQWSLPANAGGCPWDGVTRDADFSNNGTVGSEDYSFLTANWLTLSGCACTLPLGHDGGAAPATWRAANDALSRAADLDKNGRVDVADVELFERRNGLSGELSRKMRATR